MGLPLIVNHYRPGPVCHRPGDQEICPSSVIVLPTSAASTTMSPVWASATACRRALHSEGRITGGRDIVGSEGPGIRRVRTEATARATAAQSVFGNDVFRGIGFRYRPRVSQNGNPRCVSPFYRASDTSSDRAKTAQPVPRPTVLRQHQRRYKRFE